MHFQTFVEVLVAVIQQGQAESKRGVSQARQDLLIDEWQKMSKTLRAHMNTLLLTQQKVCVVFAANRYTNEFFGLVFDAALTVKNSFPNSAPPEGECAGINAPAFTMLRELTSRGSLSLLGWMATALELPRLGSVTAAAAIQEKSGRWRRSPISYASAHSLAFRVGLAADTHTRGNALLCGAEVTVHP